MYKSIFFLTFNVSKINKITFFIVINFEDFKFFECQVTFLITFSKVE